MESRNLPVKSFDDHLERDKQGSFLVTYSQQCFRMCVNDVSSNKLDDKQTDCLNKCYTRAFNLEKKYNKH